MVRACALSVGLAITLALLRGCGCGKDQGEGGASMGGSSSDAGDGSPALGGSTATGGTTSSGGGSTGGSGSTGGGGSSAGGSPTGGTSAGGSAGSDGGGGAAGDGGLPACPTFADGVAMAKVQKAAVTEASGIVESRKTKGVFFVHNDSGDTARVFAVGQDGKDLGTFVFQGAGAIDWEDIAIGPGPKAGESYLYAGDIGDNPSARPDVKVYRAVEPKVDPGAPSGTVTLTGIETFTLKYPDGAHNAETLLVDPATSDLFIVVKADGTSPVFRAQAPLSSATLITMDKIATLVFGSGSLPGGKQTTGGDISAQGDLIAIRTYTSAFAWRRTGGMSVADALGGPPCPIPLHAEPQGEALGFSTDGSAYVTVSEGTSQPIYRFAKQ